MIAGAHRPDVSRHPAIRRKPPGFSGGNYPRDRKNYMASARNYKPCSFS